LPNLLARVQPGVGLVNGYKLERRDPIIEHARQSPGPVCVERFPYDISLAGMAVEIRLHDRPVPIVEGRGAPDGLNLRRGFGGRAGMPQVR
jgi:hypothetical protein